MELVTGHQGRNHVTSAQVRALNSAIFDGGNYVIKYGQMFDANQNPGLIVNINPGAAVMADGGFIVSEATEQVALDSLTELNMRIDIIGIRRSVVDGIESAELHVEKGDVSTNPSAPDVSGMSSTFMPLWMVTVRGTSFVGLPVKMYETYQVKHESDYPIEHLTPDGEFSTSYIKWESGRIDYYFSTRFEGHHIAPTGGSVCKGPEFSVWFDRSMFASKPKMLKSLELIDVNNGSGVWIENVSNGADINRGDNLRLCSVNDCWATGYVNFHLIGRWK